MAVEINQHHIYSCQHHTESDSAEPYLFPFFAAVLHIVLIRSDSNILVLALIVVEALHLHAEPRNKSANYSKA